jgi:hypothetical protein
MSERSNRGELLSWPEPLPESEGERADLAWEKAEDSSVALVRTEAALVAARNEIALLRARVARLQRDNERLESDLAGRKPS